MNPSTDLGLVVDEILAELHAATPAVGAHDPHVLYLRRALPFARALAARARRVDPDDDMLPRVATLLTELALDRDEEVEIFADLRAVTRGYALPEDASEPLRDLMSELVALDEHFAQRLRP